jgi:lipid-binding SYLF domain-containing protein
MALSLATALPVVAQSASVSPGAERVAANAIAAFAEVNSHADSAIPSRLMSAATCVASLHMWRAGYIVGARAGKGLVSCRQADGSWGAPLFLRAGGLSYGGQIGVQELDVVLVFTTRQAFDNLARGDFTLGADMSVVAGPAGRNATVSTNVPDLKPVYQYVKARGLFAGVFVEGAVLDPDTKENYAAYGARANHEILGSAARLAPSPLVGAYANALVRYAH